MSRSSIPCPSCRTVLRAPAHLAAGTTIRCHRCDTVFRHAEKIVHPLPSWVASELEAQAIRPRDENKDQPVLRRWSEGEAPPVQREQAPRRATPDQPRRSNKSVRKEKRKQSNAGLILGLAIGGGVGLLAVLVAVVVVICVTIGRKDAPAVAAAPPVVKPPPAVNLPPVVKPPPAPEPPSIVAAPPASNPTPIVNPPPVANPPPMVPAPSGNGALAAEVLDKVKKATVYIRVTSAEGLASGSGFFEAGSSMVLTNAHVVSMLHADDPAPQKVEVVVQSGERDEKTLAARILAVDRISDLAVLSVDLAAAGLTAPQGLTVASASGLRETQQVYVFGFPFGEGLGKNITVSTSSVSSLRKDKDGVLAQVQVNGGMNPGNSGGPVVDSLGQVVGVAVAGIRGTQINFAIPGDSVQAVFRGRLFDVRVGEPYKKGDQIAVPVDVTAIDPMHRLRSVAVDWWTGDPKDVVGPSTTTPLAPAAPQRQTTPMTYQPDAMTGHADLILASLPPPGKVLWVQPTYVDGSGQPVWLGGLPAPLSEPVDAKPAVLALRPQMGKTRLGLKSTATVQLRTSDGEKHSLYNNIETQMIEDVRAIDARGVASVYDTFEKFAVGVSIDGKGPPPSPRMQHIVQDVGKLGLSLTVDPQGDLAQKQRDLSRVPAASREALDGFGDQILQSLDVAAVPVPGGLTQPGQSWKASRNVPIDTIDTYSTAAADMTYTYRGVRTLNGQDYGILDLHGVVRPLKGTRSDLAGRVQGTAAVDLASGRVYQVHAVVDVTLDVRFLDESLRSNGKLEVNLTRTAP